MTNAGLRSPVKPPTALAAGHAPESTKATDSQSPPSACGLPTKPGGTIVSIRFGEPIGTSAAPLSSSTRLRVLNSKTAPAETGWPPAWVNSSPSGSRTEVEKALKPKGTAGSGIEYSSLTAGGSGELPPKTRALVISGSDGSSPSASTTSIGS